MNNTDGSNTTGEVRNDIVKEILAKDLQIQSLMKCALELKNYLKSS